MWKLYIYIIVIIIATFIFHSDSVAISQPNLALTELNGRKYFFGLSPTRTWSEAKFFCRSHQMELASIENNNENDNIKYHLEYLRGPTISSNAVNINWWIGASDVPTLNGTLFVWSGTNRTVTYTNWNPNGVPNLRVRSSHYVAMQSDGKWFDYTQSTRKERFICEKEDRNVAAVFPANTNPSTSLTVS